MNEKITTRSSAYKAQERLFSALSAGAFFILLGIIYVINLRYSLWNEVFDFLGSFTLRSVPNVGISLPAPSNPAAHTVLYTAAFQFCIGLGILQIILLVLRLVLHSSIGKTTETVGNLVYWFGSAYLITAYLSGFPNISQWFMFWAGILIILGLSLIARAFILLAKKWVSS